MQVQMWIQWMSAECAECAVWRVCRVWCAEYGVTGRARARCN